MGQVTAVAWVRSLVLELLYAVGMAKNSSLFFRDTHKSIWMEFASGICFKTGHEVIIAETGWWLWGSPYNVSFFLSFFFFFWPPCSTWSSGHQNCKLSCTCGSARSLTHCAGLGTEPVSQHSQDTADPTVPQQELLKLFLMYVRDS